MNQRDTSFSYYDSTGMNLSTNDDKKNNENDSVSSLDNNPSPPFTKILSLAKPEYPILFLSFILMIVSEGLQLYIPVILAEAYNDLVDPSISNTERMTLINQVMVYVLLFHCGAELASFVRLTIMQCVGERVVARLRVRLYDSILKQEISFFDRHKSGELVSRLGSDTALLQQGTSQAVPESVVGVLQFIVAVGLMIWISAKLAAVMVAFCVVMMIVSVPFGMILSKLTKDYQTILGEAQSNATESLQAMRTVQSFGAEKNEVKRYEQKIGNPSPTADPVTTTKVPNQMDTSTTYSVGYKKAWATAGFWSFITFAGFGGMYITLWYGFKLVNDGEISLGDLTAFQSYIFIIGGSLGLTTQAFTQVIEATGVAGRIFYLLEREPEIPGVIVRSSGNEDNDPEKPCVPFQPTTMEGSVDFNNVTFAYPSRPDAIVLNNFSLSINANETVAFVGASGSGKSTSLALLQRFYDTTKGSITIDGHDIRNVDLHWLRSHMAYVQQEPQLFGFSIRENIVYGIQDRIVSQSELDDAAKQANAYDFITEWKSGYDTLVGERGVQLSGGQKQRIAIARALIRNPRILLLDEATSALDAESEHAVQVAIDKAIVGRTVLIVAHRLSTIQNADQIVVVDDHCIVDVGTHTDLLDRCPKYQDLIKRQTIQKLIDS